MHRWSVSCAPKLLKTALIFSSSVGSPRWHGGQHLRVGWSRLQPTLSGDPSAWGLVDGHQNGNRFSLLCGLFGFNRTMLSSEAAPLQPKQFSTTQGGSLNYGTKAASASRVLDLCNGLFVPLYEINNNRGHHLGCLLCIFKKNNSLDGTRNI